MEIYYKQIKDVIKCRNVGIEQIWIQVSVGNVGDLDNHMASHTVGVLIHEVDDGKNSLKKEADYGAELLATGRVQCSLSQAKGPETRGTDFGDSVPSVSVAIPGEVDTTC